MAINTPYRGPRDLPARLPVLPVAGALLLPRGHLPLNIFEPRYVAMVDAALAGDRLIGMIQPSGEGNSGEPPLQAVGCAGRITQFAETGDGRYVMTLTGVARYRIVEELATKTPWRRCEVDFSGFPGDFAPECASAANVDRKGVVAALRRYAEENSLGVDWRSVEEAGNEPLVNALAMMSPYGPTEKQALLEAADVKARADVLVAITELELRRNGRDRAPLQ